MENPSNPNDPGWPGDFIRLESERPMPTPNDSWNIGIDAGNDDKTVCTVIHNGNLLRRFDSAFVCKLCDLEVPFGRLELIADSYIEFIGHHCDKKNQVTPGPYRKS